MTFACTGPHDMTTVSGPGTGTTIVASAMSNPFGKARHATLWAACRADFCCQTISPDTPNVIDGVVPDTT